MISWRKQDLSQAPNPSDMSQPAGNGAGAPKPKSTYDESHIRALEGIEGIRLRPAMYIGDTTLRGLHHLVYEVVDNSVDEAIGGHATTIITKINADGSVTIIDDGRGI